MYLSYSYLRTQVNIRLQIYDFFLIYPQFAIAKNHGWREMQKYKHNTLFFNTLLNSKYGTF